VLRRSCRAGARSSDSFDAWQDSSRNLDDYQIKHLELIQGVITRMAGNSFQTKAWAVALVAALLGFGVDRESAGIAGVAVFPALVFLWLDAYYLRQERLFRKLYDAVRQGKLTVATDAFTMNTKDYHKSVDSWPRTMLASTIWPLHACTVAAAIGVAIYLLLADSNGGLIDDNLTIALL